MTLLMYVNGMHVHVHTRVCVLIQPGRDIRVRLYLCTRTYKPGFQWEPAQACVVKGRGALWGPRGAGSRHPGTAPARARGSVIPETSRGPALFLPSPNLCYPEASAKGWRDGSLRGLPATCSGGFSLCALGRLRPQADHHSAACPQPAQASVGGVGAAGVGGVGRASVSVAPVLAVRESPWEPPPSASTRVSAAGSRGSSCIPSLQPARRTSDGRPREMPPPRARPGWGPHTGICSVGLEMSSATQRARKKGGAGGYQVSCLQQSGGNMA